MFARYPPWYQGSADTMRSVDLKTMAFATASRYQASLKSSGELRQACPIRFAKVAKFFCAP